MLLPGAAYDAPSFGRLIKFHHGRHQYIIIYQCIYRWVGRWAALYEGVRPSAYQAFANVGLRLKLQLCPILAHSHQSMHLHVIFTDLICIDLTLVQAYLYRPDLYRPICDVYQVFPILAHSHHSA
jgi:hypothetical protein